MPSRPRTPLPLPLVSLLVGILALSPTGPATAYDCSDHPYTCADLPPGTVLFGGYTFDDGGGGSLQGWTGVDVSGAGDFAAVEHLVDLEPALTQCACAVDDYVLVLYDEANFTFGHAHPDGQDNYAQSPWIDISSYPGASGRVIVFDAHFANEYLSYVFPQVLVQWRVNGTPSAWTAPDSPLNLMAFECSIPGEPYVIDVSSVVPSNADEVRIGLGVVNNCSLFPGCSGFSPHSSPWYDNVFFGVYTDPTAYADSDGDGVTDAEENDGPYNGDGNNDGIDDRFQPYVTSVRAFGGSHYFVMELPAPTANAGPPEYAFRCVETLDPATLNPPPPSWISFPCGAMSFRTTYRSAGPDPDVQFDLSFAPFCNPNGYGKLTSSGWIHFNDDGTTGVTFFANDAEVALADNARGDNDAIDFIISDPGGVAVIDLLGAPDDRGRSPAVSSAPSPFRSSVTIAYTLEEPAMTGLRIFDLEGRAVRLLQERTLRPEGRHEVSWDGRTDAGEEVPAGVYFYRLDRGGVETRGRMVRIR